MNLTLANNKSFACLLLQRVDTHLNVLPNQRCRRCVVAALIVCWCGQDAKCATAEPGSHLTRTELRLLYGTLDISNLITVMS